jgi:thymidylate synthase (FAD)
MTKILDHGYVKLLNISGPIRRPSEPYDAHSRDPAMVARTSFDNMDLDRTLEMDMKLVKYLTENKHTTPLEMITVWFDMKMPMFLARQIIRHRTSSVNEVSGRYVTLPAEWYIPELKNVGIKSKSNKQGRTMEGGSKIKAWWFTKSLRFSCWSSYQLYKASIKLGIPNELARTFLHLNHYTHWVWKQDLHNLLHLIRLRRHSHAQYEARVLADAAYDHLCRTLPQFMKLWDELEQDQKDAQAWLKERNKRRKEGKSTEYEWNDCSHTFFLDKGMISSGSFEVDSNQLPQNQVKL